MGTLSLDFLPCVKGITKQGANGSYSVTKKNYFGVPNITVAHRVRTTTLLASANAKKGGPGNLARPQALHAWMCYLLNTMIISMPIKSVMSMAISSPSAFTGILMFSSVMVAPSELTA